MGVFLLNFLFVYKANYMHFSLEIKNSIEKTHNKQWEKKNQLPISHNNKKVEKRNKHFSPAYSLKA